MKWTVAGDVGGAVREVSGGLTVQALGICSRYLPEIWSGLPPSQGEVEIPEDGGLGSAGISEQHSLKLKPRPGGQMTLVLNSVA